MTTLRRQAREAALQVLYFWEIGRADPASAFDAFFAEHLPDAPDAVRTFAETLVAGTTADVAALDALLEPHLAHWRLARLAIVDRLILRMAAWELRQRETAAPIVINEAIELARRFGSEESARFVNGVLDSVRKGLEA